MKSLLFLAFILCSFEIFAQSDDGFELYSEKDRKSFTLSISTKIKNDLYTVILKNEGPNATSTIYPIHLSNFYNKGIDVVSDECAFTHLLPEENCKILMKKIDLVGDPDLHIFTYLENASLQKKTFTNVFKLNKSINTPQEYSTSKIIQVINPPEFFKIGAGDIAPIAINLDIKDPNIQIYNPRIKEIKTICTQDSCEISFNYQNPLEQELNEQFFVFQENNLIGKFELSFNITLRKTNNIDFLKYKYYPVNYSKSFPQAKAVYTTGIPKESPIHKSLIFVNQSKILNFESEDYQVIEVTFFNSHTYKYDIHILKNELITNNESLVIESPVQLKSRKNSFKNVTISNKGILQLPKGINVIIADSFILNGAIEFVESDIQNNTQTVLTNPFLNINKTYTCEDNCLFILSKNKININHPNVFTHHLPLEPFDKLIIDYQEKLATSKLQESNQKGSINNSIKESPQLLGAISFSTRYLVCSILLWVILSLIGKKYKINSNRIPLKTNLKYLLTSLFNSSFIIVLVSLLIVKPLTGLNFIRLYSDYNEYHKLWYIFSFVFVILLHDVYFYFTHRLLHTKFLMKHVHYVHHQANNPSSFTAFHFHPVEATIHFLFSPLLICLVPIHQDVLIFFLWFSTYWNAQGHAGYDFLKPIFRKLKINKFIATPYHHSLHHEENQGKTNFSIYFNILDLLFKTENSNYKKTYSDENSERGLNDS